MQKPDQTRPLEPREALGAFQLDPDFIIELVAAEPDVVDPVAFSFDAKGDLYVVEMRGYPNAGVGTGKPNLPGRIKKLQDRDGDGYFETSTVFVDHLRFPTGIMSWREGILIGDAPELIFAADTDGDGKADVRRTLYTGFGTSNIQQMINGLQLHFDNWVCGCNGGNESPVRSLEKPGTPVVQLRGMHFRLRPDVPGSLEPTSGGGQYGLAVTESGAWLTCTNSQHIRQVILPDHYLRRNPNLAVPAVTLDIADHGAACRVFRISPFEAWRVERTTRRAGDPVQSKRFESSELVPGGFVTSACGPAVWRSDGTAATTPPASPLIGGGENAETVFVCDPANNLIHRDVLSPEGSRLAARRHERDREKEFLASTDTWFRPVFLAVGPDGALYVADFYREIIETPLSLPDDIKARWNLNSRARGRIWRIRPKGRQSSRPGAKLAGSSNADLLRLIGTEASNAWQVNTAHRLLVERMVTGRDREECVASVRGWFREPQAPAVSLIHGLWLIDHWRGLQADDVERALRHHSTAVVVQGLALAERVESIPEHLKRIILETAGHRHAHVRFQLALSVGSLPLTAQEKAGIILRLAIHPERDQWLETALLSSTSGAEMETLARAVGESSVSLSFLERLAAITGRAVNSRTLMEDAKLKRMFAGPLSERALVVLQGLGREFVEGQPEIAAHLVELADAARGDEAASIRTAPILALVPFARAEPRLRDMLAAQQPLAVQQAALRALAGQQDRRVAVVILEHWPAWGPQMRRQAEEVLFGRAEFLRELLSPGRRDAFSWRQLDPARREQLLRHSDRSIREQSARLLSAPTASRADVLKRYRGALTMAGDVKNGRVVFQKQCASCHQFDGMGHAVGPDLAGALGNKTAESLLVDMIDPNREVDSRYVNYVITTRHGRTLTGMIATESGASITLRRAEGVQEDCLRIDIEEMQGTGKSMMPENLEEQMNVQEVADVIAYLLAKRK